MELLRGLFSSSEKFMKTKDPAGCFASGEALVDLGVQKSLLAGSGGLSHLRGKLLGAALHFFRRDVLHMLCEAPLMPEGIGQLAVAIAPELIVEWHVDFGARRDGAVKGSVHVFQVQEKTARVLGSWRGRAGHAGELVGQHKPGVADLYFGVADFAVRAGHSHNFLGAEN